MFCLVSWQVAAADQPEAPPDPRQAMITALAALSPHPSLGDEARVFDRFVGTWDCDFTFFLPDGSVKHAAGELEFGWILDGQAVQDIWITYPKEAGKERGIGTTVRFFDAKSKTWRIIFVGPAYGALLTVQGGMEGDRLVLRGVDDKGTRLRWSFNDIQAGSFTWRGETSGDGGKTWKLEEEHHMRRRGGSNDRRTDMIRTLRAAVPSPALGAQAQVFDRFVGTWDLDCVLYGAKGKVSRFSGQWIFGWALDGKLEQDVIITGGEGERRARGTTLRFYDARSRNWRIVWIAPESGNVAILKGGAVGDRIVLEGAANGEAFRWSFNDIRRDSFVWRGEVSADGGKTWQLEQEMRLKRRGPAA
ncbi:MAG TPA: hypothetical protein VKA60_23590 [Blastocatellia bacterium]|nr:hypothetical protein [Blastocatellia bacterium]